MSSNASSHYTSSEQQMRQVIEEAQRALRQTEEFFVELGVDPETFHAQIEAQMTPEAREQAEKALEEDMRSIQETVEMEKLNTTQTSTTGSSSVRKMRRMI